jgi:pimeloyl-ACP methyl ester carboxylesterase
MVKKTLKYLGFLTLILIIVYFLGPKVDAPNLSPKLPIISNHLSEINNLVFKQNQDENIRKGNHSRIIWADSVPTKTEYSVVYLHGFSASPAENEVIYSNFSKRYHTNLYAPRLYEHGLKGKESLLNFTAKGYLNSAKEAIAIGMKMGEKAILFCTSTGATAGLYLAANHPEIEALILVSPNVDVYDSASNLITKPWGKEILKMAMGGNYQIWQPPNNAEKYWYGKYRIEAIIQLKSLIQATMKKETFEKIKQPFFMGYYYKNEKEQDKVVSVKRMLEMFEQTATPSNLKVKKAFPNSKNHSLASGFFNPNFLEVQDEIFKFTETTLNIKPKINE